MGIHDAGESIFLERPIPKLGRWSGPDPGVFRPCKDQYPAALFGSSPGYVRGADPLWPGTGTGIANV